MSGRPPVARIIHGMTPDAFVRNLVTVVVEMAGPSGAPMVWTRSVADDGGERDGWYDPEAPGRGDDPTRRAWPEGTTPYALQLPRPLAYEVYQALRDEFEGADTTPVASDRAYSDARTDITRLHELLDSTIGALIERPHVIAADPRAYPTPVQAQTPHRKDTP